MKDINQNKVDIYDYSKKVEEDRDSTTIDTLNGKSQKIIGLLAAAGLLIGIGIRVGLCTTEILAPFSVGVLDIIAFTATIGGLALISGALGYGTTKRSSQSKVVNSTVPPQESYRVISKSLGTSSKTVKSKVNHQQTQKSPRENSLLSTNLPKTIFEEEKTTQSGEQNYSSLFG
ncbi:hypothetical protein Lsan_3301 [Legionella santicrucis]|uniref:Transmembrane protein n=1 Tax=Legionella santicrucis TaxID=45074 RepID=A0A0W0YFU5_9GAMM|nr:hypothetical protein [Legionella santicrucis]KTD55749.1 hypothetical protein Lsan_3301 [Legionella santicrucis]